MQLPHIQLNTISEDYSDRVQCQLFYRQILPLYSICLFRYCKGFELKYETRDGFDIHWYLVIII